MKITILLILSLLSFSAFSAIPTVEGLFRNGNNPAVDGDFVVIKLQLEEVEQKLEHHPDEENEDLQLAKIIKPRFLKLIFSKSVKDRLQLLQVEYEDSSMEKNKVIRSNYLPSLIDKIKTDTYVERSLFYSLWVMLGLNDSKAMNIILGRYGMEFQDNKALVNQDKVKLMEEYKKYLTAIKTDETLKEELTSPLKPEAEEEKERIKEVKGAPFYTRDGKVSLVRNNSEIFWKVNLESIHAYFTHENHRLNNLEINTAAGNTIIKNGQYILFDGIHELPKVMFIKDMLDRMFKIKVLSLATFKNKGKKLSERAIDYNKLVQQRPFGTRKFVENRQEERKVFIY